MLLITSPGACLSEGSRTWLDRRGHSRGRNQIEAMIGDRPLPRDVYWNRKSRNEPHGEVAERPKAAVC